MKYIVTGAAGYIAASFSYKSLQDGDKIIGVDNLSNSSLKNVKFLKSMYPNNFTFFNADVRDREKLGDIFKINKDCDAVFHFAALKDIPESQKEPKRYFENNVIGTKNLIEQMKKNQLSKLIFSSSAAVYGDQNLQPINESANLKPKSIYAETKYECEKILESESKGPFLRSVSLRYFNPIGSFGGNLIHDTNRHSLIGAILKSLNDSKAEVIVYGNNYSTKDGTGERDYIHIEDLVTGHLAAIEFLNNNQGHSVFNLGTGKSYSVLEVIEEFQQVTGKKINFKFGERRDGDPAKSYADIEKAKEKLNWKAKRDLNDMCKNICNNLV